jgi:uncharacterized protein (TIRG00374 family)
MEVFDEARGNGPLRRMLATAQTRTVAVRVIVCIGLSILAARQVEIDDVLQRADFRLLSAIAVGALLISASAWPQAARWRLIASTLDLQLDRLVALRVTLTSFFLIAVTPSTLAADGARVIVLRSTGSDWTRSIHSVLLDRFVGLAVILLLALAGIPLLLAKGPSLSNMIGLPICVAAIAAASGIALLARRPSRAWLRFRPVRECVRLAHALRTTLANRRFQFGGSLCSLVIVALSMTAFWLIAAAAGARADFTTVLALFPIVLLTSALPISVGGWGSRELGLVALYPHLGTEPSVAMAVSVSFGLATLVAGLVCIAISWWIGRRRSVSEDAFAGIDNGK